MSVDTDLERLMREINALKSRMARMERVEVAGAYPYLRANGGKTGVLALGTTYYVDWSAVVSDTGGFLPSVPSDRIQVPFTGLYVVSGWYTLASVGPTRVDVNIGTDGLGNIAGMTYFGINAAGKQMYISGFGNATAGDTFFMNYLGNVATDASGLLNARIRIAFLGKV